MYTLLHCRRLKLQVALFDWKIFWKVIKNRSCLNFDTIQNVWLLWTSGWDDGTCTSCVLKYITDQRSPGWKRKWGSSDNLVTLIFGFAVRKRLLHVWDTTQFRITLLTHSRPRITQNLSLNVVSVSWIPLWTTACVWVCSMSRVTNWCLRGVKLGLYCSMTTYYYQFSRDNERFLFIHV